MKATVMGSAVVRAAMVVEMVTMDQENRTAHKVRWPVEQGIPIILPRVRIQTERLRRQDVDLLRQARRIQRDLLAAIRLPARLPNGLSLLAFHRHVDGLVAAPPYS